MKTTLFLLLGLLGLTSACLAQTTPPATTTAPAATAAATRPAASLQEYAGTYTFESGSPLTSYTVTVKDGDLYGDAGMGNYKLNKQPKTDQYQSTSSYGSIITFTRNATTRQVTGLTLAAQGQEISATKNN